MAVPHPERELQRLQRLLKQGLPPVVIVSGAAEFFRREALDALLGAVPKGADLRTVDGGQDTDGAELLDLRGGSLFGSGTWLVVRRGDPWFKKHGDEVGAALPPAAGSGLVLEVTHLDKRTKKTKALLAHGELFEFRDLYAEPYDRSRSPLEAELVGWIVQRGKSAGAALTPEAAFLVMTAVGRQPAELVAELGRLAEGRAKGAPPLGVDDVAGQLHSSFESTPFEFAEAVLGDDRRRAERSLEAMFARGVRGKDGAGTDAGGVFPFVTSWMFQAMGQCLEGRRLLDQGVSLRDIPQRVGVRAFGDRFATQVQGLTVGRLRRGLLGILRAQRRLRLTGEEPELILRQFVAEWFRGARVRGTRTASAHAGGNRR